MEMTAIAVCTMTRRPCAGSGDSVLPSGVSALCERAVLSTGVMRLRE